MTFPGLVLSEYRDRLSLFHFVVEISLSFCFNHDVNFVTFYFIFRYLTLLRFNFSPPLSFSLLNNFCYRWLLLARTKARSPVALALVS